MKTLILGSGAVGSTLGGYLAHGGRDVTVADGWPRHVEAIRSRGLRIEAVEGDFTVALGAIHLDELADFGPADLIIIASKSFDTRMMALLAREHLHPSTVVMSAQNGMNDAALIDVFGPDRVMACVVALGADLLEPGRVRRSSATSVVPAILGYLSPGGDPARLEELRRYFEPLGAMRAVEDAWPERWGKLTLNSMSNALAGLTGLRSDTLWSQPQTLDVIIALGHETASVARSAGIDAVPVLGKISQQVLLDADSTSGQAWSEAVKLMSEIAAGRVGKKSNRASLLQDIEKERRTEIDYLNGWISREGARLGVPTPTHDMLITELRPVELGHKGPSLANSKGLAEAVRARYA